MARKRIWEKLQCKRLTPELLKKAMYSLHHCSSMTRDQIDEEEWALEIQFAHDNGYL